MSLDLRSDGGGEGNTPRGIDGQCYGKNEEKGK